MLEDFGKRNIFVTFELYSIMIMDVNIFTKGKKICVIKIKNS